MTQVASKVQISAPNTGVLEFDSCCDEIYPELLEKFAGDMA
jgi:hypothetical protein